MAMPSACSRCEKLPDPFRAPAVLHIAPPLTGITGYLRASLEEDGFTVGEEFPGIMAVPFEPERAEALASTLSGKLNEVELSDCRCVVLDPEASPSVLDLMQTQPLAAFIARVCGAWLAEMIRDGRLLTYFQPIVPSDDPGRVFAFECLLRGRSPEGELVSPDRIFQIARAAEMLHVVDREARHSAIRGARQYANGFNVFINFTPASIYDPRYCLRSTLLSAADADIDPQRIVFEVVETDYIRDVDHLSTILQYYRERGYRVALDDLGAGYGSLNLLNSLRPDFIKLDAELLRGAYADPYRGKVAAKVLEMAQSLGTQTIAEGVETPEEFDWARDHGASYVQGYHIARPACPPPQPGALSMV